jgi:hypothetical protein
MIIPATVFVAYCSGQRAKSEISRLIQVFSIDLPVFLLRPHPNPFLPVFPSHKQLKLQVTHI